MGENRIRRYENVWARSDSAPPPSAPTGFALVSLAHLSPAERATIAAQQALYQRAYEQAQAEADARFINDWII